MGGLIGLSHGAHGTWRGSSAAGTSRLLGKGWAGGDARVEGTTETIQTQLRPCRAVPAATGEGLCV